MKFKHERLQGYEYVEDIGSGGQGKVVKIKEKEKERYYALKILKEDENFEQFKREVEITKKMMHTNIVTIHDSSLDKEKGRVFMLMEYARYGDVVNYLDQNSQVGVLEKLLFIQEIAGALQCVHKQGYIHRDIKPSNIFVTDNSEGDPYAWLGDFGLAKRIEEDITETGGIVGSHLYLPFEVLIGKEKHSKESDIYGLGMSMYEILTGNHPQKNMNFMNYMQSMNNNILYTKPSSYDSLLNEKIDKICLKSIDKDKNKRYKTLEELLDDLDKCIKGYPKNPTTNRIIKKEKKIAKKELVKGKRILESNSNKKEKIGFVDSIITKFNIMYENFLLKRAELYTDTKAMIRLGKMYTAGKRGVQKNIEKSIGYYERAIAESNNAQAMYELGKIYLDGQHVKKDVNKAVHCYLMSAKKKYVKSYEAVANFYYKGIVLEKNLKKAEWYYKEIIGKEKVIPHIFYKLGKIYEASDRVDKFQLAKYYYKEAAEKNDVDAMCSLASLYVYGHAVEKDVEKALRLYKEAVKKGKKNALIHIGNLYKDGYVFSSPDYVSARYWFMEAEKEGLLEGKLNLAELYEKGGYGIDQDDVRAQEYYTSITENSNGKELEYIGLLYHRGESVKKNYAKAIEWYKKAIKKGNNECLVYIGDIFFEGGYGAIRGNRKAEKYYRNALERGDVEGFIGLGRVYEDEKMYRRAVGNYEMATKAGIQMAYLCLGNLFSEGGADLEKNYKKSVYYYELYVGVGEKIVLQKLAKLYEEGGYGIEKDYKKSLQYYEAIDTNERDYRVYMSIAKLYEMGGYGIKKDYEKANKYYSYAHRYAVNYEEHVDGGIIALLFTRMGDLYRKGGPGLGRDYVEAKEHYLVSIEYNGRITHENLFEVIEYAGLNGEEFIQVRDFLEKEDDKNSLECLGKLYEYGYGIEKNYFKAIEYYEKAFLKGQWRVGGKIVDLYKVGGYGLRRDPVKAYDWNNKYTQALAIRERLRKR